LKQQSGGGDLSAFDCVLNLVSEPDHSPNTLEALRLLLRGYRGRVINRPEAVLRTSRDEVANALRGIPGLLVPQVLLFRGGDPDAALEAVTGAGLEFPLIVRLPATHRGRSMVLVEDGDQFRSQVSAEQDYFAIEFVDYRSADGLYRKYRTWSFGGRQVFRHLAVTEHWIVHVTPGNEYMIDRPDLIDEEIRLMERVEGDFPDEVHAIITEIGERLGLDCFGVDFGFHPDGRMVLFEANAAMSFFPLVKHPRFEFRGKLFAPAQEACKAMLGLHD
jgi:glutathione synthase/RimK-type ligase-like ATP-grasp enzyme